MKRIYKYFSLALLVISYSCADLDVANPNDPGSGNVNEDVVNSLASGAMVGVLDAYTGLDDNGSFFNANVHLAWTADHTTMTNNFRSMWSQFKDEPRVAFNNSLTFPDLGIISNPWRDWNASVAQANQVINIIRDIAEAERTDSQSGALALALMAKGMSLGHLANTFDQAYVVPLDADLATLDPATVLSPYDQVLSASLQALDEAIDILGGITYSTPSNTFNGIVYTSDQLAGIANTFAAYYIVANSRNSSENSSVDWALVKSYAQNGMQSDFVVTDDATFYSHDFYCLAGLFWYFRIDHRVLRNFNSNYPKRFPTEATAVIPESDLKGAGYNGDERLDAYFKYSSDLSFFRLERGPQLRTHYYQSQYETFFTQANCIGNVSYAKAYMNDLLLAEAENEMGNTGAAIAILNNDTNPRNAVGNLPDIAGSATQAEIREIIFAERDIELGRTVFGLEHTDMRRKNALQIGTILHFPVPADELATIGLEAYSFGGVSNADGVGTADGSNSWLN